MTSATGRSTGFTLLELLVVLAVLTLLTAVWPIAAPRLFPAQQLRNESQRLVTALTAARTLARMSNQPIEFLISADHAAYGTVSDQYSLPGGLHLLRDDVRDNSAATVIHFFPDGSSDGSILVLFRDEHRVEIRVGRMLGRAEVQS